jgi:hypothetical protein
VGFYVNFADATKLARAYYFRDFPLICFWNYHQGQVCSYGAVVRPGRLQIAVRFHFLVSLDYSIFLFQIFCRLLLVSRWFSATGFKKMCFFLVFAIIAVS